MEITVRYDGPLTVVDVTETPAAGSTPDEYAAAFADAHGIAGDGFYLADADGPIVADTLDSFDGVLLFLRDASSDQAAADRAAKRGEKVIRVRLDGPVHLEGPEGQTVEDVLAWVDEVDGEQQVERAKVALLAESTREKQRKGIVDPLEALIADATAAENLSEPA